jgi:hypothetical protein
MPTPEGALSTSFNPASPLRAMKPKEFLFTLRLADDSGIIDNTIVSGKVRRIKSRRISF